MRGKVESIAEPEMVALPFRPALEYACIHCLHHSRSCSIGFNEPARTRDFLEEYHIEWHSHIPVNNIERLVRQRLVKNMQAKMDLALKR